MFWQDRVTGGMEELISYLKHFTLTGGFKDKRVIVSRLGCSAGASVGLGRSIKNLGMNCEAGVILLSLQLAQIALG